MDSGSLANKIFLSKSRYTLNTENRLLNLSVHPLTTAKDGPDNVEYSIPAKIQKMSIVDQELDFHELLQNVSHMSSNLGGITLKASSDESKYEINMSEDTNTSIAEINAIKVSN